MGDLLAGPLTHFFISCPLLGESGPREAVGKDGKLKDAKDITWYHDKDDTVHCWTTGRPRNTAQMNEILNQTAKRQRSNITKP